MEMEKNTSTLGRVYWYVHYLVLIAVIGLILVGISFYIQDGKLHFMSCITTWRSCTAH